MNVQAPMVLAGDLNLSVPFGTATSLGSPCKMGGKSLFRQRKEGRRDRDGGWEVRSRGREGGEMERDSITG